MKHAAVSALRRTRSPSSVPRDSTRQARDRRDSRWDEHRRDPPRAARRRHAGRRRQARRRRRAWTRSPPRRAPARPSSTGTSPTAPSSTSPSATGSPRSCCPSSGTRSRAATSRAQMVAAAIDTYLAFLEADPELYRFVVHQQALDRADQRPDRATSPTSSASRRRPRSSVALQQAGRDPRGRRTLGPRRRRAWSARPPTGGFAPIAPCSARELAAHLTDLAWAGLSGVVTPASPAHKEENVTSPCPPRSTRRRSRRSWTADGRTCAGRPREPARPRLRAGLRRDRCRRPASGSPASAKKLADSGRVGLGFPKEYGGEDDSGGSVTSIEMLGVRRPVAHGQGRRAVGPVRRRAAAARHQAPARQVPARRHELRPARLLRDDRDRPRLRRPAAADDVHLRPRDAVLRPAHPAPGRAQGLHRQRGQGRPDGRRLRPADHPGQEPRRARLAGADPRRGRQPDARASPSGTTARRPASTASTTAG